MLTYAASDEAWLQRFASLRRCVGVDREAGGHAGTVKRTENRCFCAPAPPPASAQYTSMCSVPRGPVGPVAPARRVAACRARPSARRSQAGCAPRCSDDWMHCCSLRTTRARHVACALAPGTAPALRRPPCNWCARAPRGTRDAGCKQSAAPPRAWARRRQHGPPPAGLALRARPSARRSNEDAVRAL